ncbi:hypothetical protein [Corynebacterium sphenisci]|nr:hypothetical protein [Corynebacterium sphenisci]
MATTARGTTAALAGAALLLCALRTRPGPAPGADAEFADIWPPEHPGTPR